MAIVGFAATFLLMFLVNLLSSDSAGWGSGSLFLAKSCTENRNDPGSGRRIAGAYALPSSAATHLSSIAIGVGSAVMPSVVRQGCAVVKCSA